MISIAFELVVTITRSFANDVISLEMQKLYPAHSGAVFHARQAPLKPQWPQMVHRGTLARLIFTTVVITRTTNVRKEWEVGCFASLLYRHHYDQCRFPPRGRFSLQCKIKSFSADCVRKGETEGGTRKPGRAHLAVFWMFIAIPIVWFLVLVFLKDHTGDSNPANAWS